MIEHIVEYNNIIPIKDDTQLMINNAQENPRINRQDRQKNTFRGSAYPKEISQ